MTASSDPQSLPSAIPAGFARAAAAMHPTVRSLLVEGADPATVPVDDLLAALGREGSPTAAEYGSVMAVPQSLSARACAALRAAVDSQRRLEADSVDGQAEHQLNLSRAALEALVGSAEAAKLWRLPTAFRARTAVARCAPAGTADPDDGGATAAAAAAAAAARLRSEAISLKRAGDRSGAAARLAAARRLAETASAFEQKEEERRQQRKEKQQQQHAEETQQQQQQQQQEEEEEAEAEVEDAGPTLQEMFVRRCSAETRPRWMISGDLG
jgi:hypothetical protein